MNHYCPKCMSYNLKEIGLNIVCNDCNHVIEHDDVEAIFDAEEENLDRKISEDKYLLLDKLLSILKMFYLDDEVEDIKLKEYFDVPKDIQNEPFYNFRENELYNFKPYRIKMVDDKYFNDHNLDGLYMPDELKMELDKYYENLSINRHYPNLFEYLKINENEKMNYSLSIQLGNDKINVSNLNDKTAFEIICDGLSLLLFGKKNEKLAKSVLEIKKRNIKVSAQVEEYYYKGLFRKVVLNQVINYDNFILELENISNNYIEYPNISLIVNKYMNEYKKTFNEKLDELCNYSGKYYSHRDYSMDLFPKVEDHFYDFDLIVIITLILDDWTDNLDEAINMLENDEFGDCTVYGLEALDRAISLMGVALRKDNPLLKDYVYSCAGHGTNLAGESPVTGIYRQV